MSILNIKPKIISEKYIANIDWNIYESKKHKVEFFKW